MFIPPRSQLRGLSLEVAELYGKPHIGAFYEGKSVKSHKKESGAICPCCGKHAQSVHHVPPLSKGREFVLCTPNGSYQLKPSLFALCGDGTRGCHNGFHGGAQFKPTWQWRKDEFAKDWWDGAILLYADPHSDDLFEFGYWRIFDLKRNEFIEVGR